MKKDPYKILGVSSTATDAEIEKAYRKIARRKHPDRHPGNTAVMEEFKEVTAAYTLLSDSQERAKYDQMQSVGSVGWQQGDFGGEAQFGSCGSGWSTVYSDGVNMFSGFARSFGNSSDSISIEDMIQQMFGITMRSTPRRVSKKSKDYHINIELTFLESVLGVKKRIRLPIGREVNVNIPAGAVSGQTVKLQSMGEQGVVPGDLHLTLQVSDHNKLRRKGHDIHVSMPISMADAEGNLLVPTIRGDVKVNVANRKKSEVLRLKGMGIKSSTRKGDQYVTLT